MRVFGMTTEIGTLHYNMSAHASQAFSTYTSARDYRFGAFTLTITIILSLTLKFLTLDAA